MKQEIIEKATLLLKQKAKLQYETARKEWRNSIVFLSLSFFFLLVFVAAGAVILSVQNLFSNEALPEILSPIFFGMALFCLLLSYRFWTKAKEKIKEMKEAKRLLS